MENTATSPAYTKGPWQADWLHDELGWILDAEGNYLAEIVVKDELGFVASKMQQQANARLIAAAPELFEALDCLLEQTVDQDLAYGIELTEGEKEARQKALAAIAKTYGSAP